MDAKSPFKRIQIEAVVIRADGTREPLGVIADSKWGTKHPARLLAAARIRKANTRRN